MDERVSAIAADMPERLRADLKAAIGELQSRLASEKDPLVRQDLQILIDSADRDVRQSEINERHMLPYIDTAALVYSGISTLLRGPGFRRRDAPPRWFASASTPASIPAPLPSRCKPKSVSARSVRRRGW